MKKTFPFGHFFIVLFVSFSWAVSAQVKPLDSTNISVRKEYRLPNPTRYEPFYDLTSGNYYLYPKIGNVVVGAPLVLTAQEYAAYNLKNSLQDYYQKKRQPATCIKKIRKRLKKKGSFQV